MALKGTYYAINGIGVTSPDDEQWRPIVIGDDLMAQQKRSPFIELQWTKQVMGVRATIASGHFDWFDYDNTILSELKTTAYGSTDMYTIYTDVICQSVVYHYRIGVANQVVATFLVNLDSELPGVA